MSRLSVAIHNDLQLLALARDEAKLQAHLFKAEAQNRWQDLEKQWGDLKVHIERAEQAADGTRHEAEAALKLLLGSLRDGYHRVRSALSG